MKKVNVAVVGATGMVGRTFLKVLEERQFPIENIYFFSSKKSAGSTITFAGKDYTVEELTETAFDGKNIQIALFSAGGATSEKFAPIAASKGIIVVDNSAQWRMDPDVPLIVPEVNPEAIKEIKKGIIANPNCSTIQAMVPLKPLYEKYGLKRIVFSTYQAVSGSGVRGVKDLEDGIAGKPNQFYPHPIAYNCLPHIDVFMDNGYTKEEMKMINETRKILGHPYLPITSTCVRVPVSNCHGESINVEFEKSFEISDVITTLKTSPGILVLNDDKNDSYPINSIANGHDDVLVGRIRRDFSKPNSLNLWVVADNLRKGAASNAIQIVEKLLNMEETYEK